MLAPGLAFAGIDHEMRCLSNSAWQIGNTVPPPLARATAA